MTALMRKGVAACRFQVRWLERPGKSEDSTLTGADICLIARKDIMARPEIKEFHECWLAWEARKGASSGARRESRSPSKDGPADNRKQDKRKQAKPQKLSRPFATSGASHQRRPWSDGGCPFVRAFLRRILPWAPASGDARGPRERKLVLARVPAPRRQQGRAQAEGRPWCEEVRRRCS